MSDPMTALRYYMPKGKVEVKAAWDKVIPGWEPRITQLYEADPNACYAVDRHANAFFDDDINIEVDPTTGLLSCVSATSTDQSLNALGSLVSAAGSFLTFGAELGPVMDMKARGPDEFLAVKTNAFISSFTVTVDPTNPSAKAYVVSPEFETKESERIYAQFDITLQPIKPEPPPKNKPVTTLNGIVVRMPIPYRFQIKTTYFRNEGKFSKQFVSKEQIVLLPDEEHDYFLPLNRIPLVTTSTKVFLRFGMVQSLQRGRPSMVNAIVGVPKAILGALVPVPLQIRQQQANIVKAGSDIATGQYKILNPNSK